MDATFEFSDALQLLGIGMLTVFLILFLVVFLGNVIIRFVNRFIPATEVVLPVKRTTSSSTIDAKKITAIVAAVQSVTQGRGRVVKIEKN